MNKRNLIGLAILLLICPLLIERAYFYYVDGPVENDLNADNSVQQMAVLQQDLDQAEADRARLKEELADSLELVRQQEVQAADTATQIAELTESVAALEEEKSEEEAAEETSENEDESEEKKRPKTLDQIRAKIKGNAVAGAQIKALTEMIYADFINGLDLDPDTKAEFRALLAESYMETIALSQYAMADGEIPWSEVDSWTREERAYLDEQLRALLSDEEYATWSEYSSTIDERQLEGTLRTQIRSFASGLTDENFEIVMQVAVEEFRAQQIALEQSNTPFTQSENILYQIRAMTEMRNRLGEYLSEAQYAEIENWLTMAENLMNSQLPQEEAE